VLNGTTNDGPAVNSALAAIKAKGGGTLFIPAGILYTTTQILADFDNLTIRGSGIGVTIIKVGADIDGIRVANGYPVTTTRLKNITISDFSVNMNKTGWTDDGVDTDGNGVNLNSVDRSIVERVEVYDGPHQGIVHTYWEGSPRAGNEQTSGTIKDCIVRNTEHPKIAIGSEGEVRGISILNNTVLGGGEIYVGNIAGEPSTTNGMIKVSGNKLINTSTNPGSAIYVDSRMRNVIIDGNFIENYAIGIRTSPNNGSIGDFIISNNIIKDWVTSGIITVPSGTDNTSNTVISGNHISSTVDTPSTTQALYISHRNVVTGNYIKTTTSIGLEVFGSNNIITGNKIDNPTTVYGIILFGDNNVVTGNTYNRDIEDSVSSNNKKHGNYLNNSGGIGVNRWSEYYVGSTKHSFGSGAPTDNTVTNTAGDVVWNIEVGDVVLWRCTATGAPGTWKSVSGI
jgi:hypothetical protein